MDFASLRASRQEAPASGPSFDVVCVLTARDGALRAELLFAGPLGRSGRAFDIQDARPLHARRVSLPDIVNGASTGADGQAVPGTGLGEIIAFKGARAHGDTLFVEDIAFRAHDGMTAAVQVVRGLVRPTRFSSGKAGFTQYMDVIDPAYAIRTRRPEAMSDLLGKAMARAWPGGIASVILVDAEGRQTKVTDKRREGAEAAILEAVESDEIVSGQAYDVVPTWTMPMGRDHSWQETNPRTDHKSEWGAISRGYVVGRNAQFKDSVFLVTVEDEWKFGAATGRRHQVAAGLLPIHGKGPQKLSDVGLAPYVGSAAPTLRFFYSTPEQMSAACEQRAARRPAVDIEQKKPTADRLDHEDRDDEPKAAPAAFAFR